MPTLFLIDGHAQIHRAFHALEGLTAPDGQPTNAVYGFIRMLLKIQNDHVPDALIAVFDPPGKTFRHDLYPDYKATRKATPPELKSQIPVVLDLVRLHDIPVVVEDGVEADDVLGSLAADRKSVV